MNEVGSPAIPEDDEGILIEAGPVALRLLSYLQKEGVKVTFQAELQAGDPLIRGPGWIQLNIRRPENTLSLAQTIIDRCGKDVIFADLVLPRAGVEFIAIERAHAVSVRHLVAYRVHCNDFQQRWDVLVRPS